MTLRSDIARAAGYTLIEMIVVIAILGLMMVLVTVNGTPVSPATHARAAAQAISGALRSARAQAVTSNRTVQWTIDVAGRTYQSDGASREALPGDLHLELLAGTEDLATSAVGRVRFNPDGSSSGGRVSIEGGGQTWWVGIDWLSGRVSVVEKPH